MYEASKNSGSIPSLFTRMIADPSGGVLRELRSQLREVLEVADKEATANPSKRGELDSLQTLCRAAEDILDKAEIQVQKVRCGM